MSNKNIRQVQLSDVKDICEIYNYYVENTSISFEEELVSEEEIEKRIVKITKSYPWIVYELENRVVAYAYVSKWKERSAYRFTVEDTIYVKNDVLGKGIGQILLKGLLEEIIKQDIHVVIAVIALPNERSIKVHEKFGFKKAAHFTKVGYKNKNWIDVGYWELQIEKKV